MNSAPNVLFDGKLRDRSLSIGLILVGANLVLISVYLLLIVKFGAKVEYIDPIDTLFEASSAFIALFMFVVVAFIRVKSVIRIPLLAGLLLIQFGRATDCLDEFIIFSIAHWSALGDGLTLLGEILAAFAATYWLKQAYKVSVTDELTQLYNRHYLESVFEKASYFRRNSDESNIALIMLDADNFKRVNDCYGHATGDDVLKVMANLLLENTRKTDVVARQGGEEFEVLLLQTDIGEAVALAERIRCAFENYSNPALPAFTASLGVAEYVFGDDIKSLRRRADIAVYQAKNNGKNQVILADKVSHSAGLISAIVNGERASASSM